MKRRRNGMTWEHLTFVESDTKVGTEYEIKRRGDGALGCSCVSFRFCSGQIGTGKTCKHLQALGMATGAVPSSAPVRREHVPVPRVTIGAETFTFRALIIPKAVSS